MKEISNRDKAKNNKALANLRLLVEDGPLNHIKRSLSFGEAWLVLKNQYDKEGFSNIYILIKKFINLPFNKAKVDNFLNDIKAITDELKAKNIKLPETFLNAWLLEKLDNSYKDFKSNIYSQFRQNEKAYTLETLIANIADESRRKQFADSNSEEEINYLSSNSKKKGKDKEKYCSHCKKAGHNPSDCYQLFPHKSPYNKNKVTKVKKPSNKSRSERDKREKALIAKVEELKLNRVTEVSDSESEKQAQNYSSDEEMDEVLYLSKIPKVQIAKANFTGLIDFIRSKEAISKENSDILKKSSLSFIYDSGSTSHILENKQSFYSYKELNKQIYWGGAKSTQIKGIGNAYIIFTDTGEKRLLKNALHVPDLGVNIISQSKIANHIAILTPSILFLVNKDTSSLLTIGKNISNLYYLPIKVLKPKEKVYNTIYKNSEKEATLYNIENISLETIHKRMGHISLKAIKRLKDSTIGFNIINTTNFDINRCEECNEAKMLKQRHKVSLNNLKSLDYLEKVTSDICGPIKPLTYNKYKYFITFLDKKSRYLKVSLLRYKSKVLEAFNNYKAKAENNKDNKKIRIFATDNDTEYINDEFKLTLNKLGIIHQKSPIYTKEPNGLIERPNRTLLNKVRALIYTANLPRYLWGEALLASVYIYNRTPHSSLQFKTPFEVKNNQKPILNNIKIFGSICYYSNNKAKSKLEPRANKGVLIGYGEQSNIYKIFDLNLKKAIWSRDVKIYENIYLTPYKTLSKDYIQALEGEITIEESNFKNQRIIPNSKPSDSEKVSEISQNGPKKELEPVGNKKATIYIDLPKKDDKFLSQYKRVEDTSYYTMDFDINNEFILITNLNSEPKTYSEAINSITSKEWLEAMKTEVSELENQVTYTLVPLPDGKKALGGRWVYKVKTDSKGDIIKYKARWVV